MSIQNHLNELDRILSADESWSQDHRVATRNMDFRPARTCDLIAALALEAEVSAAREGIHPDVVRRILLSWETQRPVG